MSISKVLLLALVATNITYFFTIMGSATVFFFKKINKNLMDIMLGLSGGIMISASFFSLINPAIEYSKELHQIPWVIVSIGILLGGLLLYITDKYSDKILSNNKLIQNKRIFMLLFSITIHNVPEGLVVGVAFGNILHGVTTIREAILLTIGIALQNFPEGSALSLPMLRDGMSKKKSFFLGQISGVVEVPAGIIGALLVLKIKMIMPLLLSFAAGAMLYVVIEEIIPESQTNEKKGLVALFTIIGFIVMMILDIM